jgi:PAS domain S-box-containing protein
MAMALPHLLVGIWQRRAANLFFVLAAVAVIGIAIVELLMMHAGSAEEFGWALRWGQVPIFVLTIALVGFVSFYFGTGRLWLAISICAVRLACLVVNFVVHPNLSFREITGLQNLQFLGQTVTIPLGVVSQRIHLSEVSSFLLFVFVLDASISLWRQGNRDRRRRAVIVGGSILFFVVLAAGITGLIHRHVIVSPYLVSFPFAAILVAMVYELSSDLFRARQVAQKLQLSEASLSESETRFQNAANAAPVMIWVAGTDKLCTFINKAWLDFTGRSVDQELGNGWTEVIHPDDYGKCLKTYVNSFDDREPFVMQYRVKHSDGQYRWITDQGAPRYDARGRFVGYVGTCVDISDFLRRERALYEFEERVTLAAGAARLGVWELNTNSNEFWMSDQACDLFHFDRGKPVTFSMFRDRIHTDDRPSRDAMIDDALKKRAGYEIEYRALLPDGTVRWIAGRARCIEDERGNPTRLLGVSMDVTERKQAEQLFQLATEASPSGVLLVDDDGAIVLVNAHVEELFGYGRDELVGEPVEKLLPERFAGKDSTYRTKFLAALRSGASKAGRELSARRKNGSVFPVEISLNSITTPQGVLVLVSIVDISFRKRAEEEAHRQREQINLLSRASLLGEMTASLAHELNQPLSAIISNANAGMRFIDQGKADSETMREILNDVAADGRRAHDIIDNVRGAIKGSNSIRGPINLNDVVRAVAHMVEGEAAARVCEIRMSLAENLPLIEGDPTQLQQVLINLVNNAFDAMVATQSDHRRIELSTEGNGNGTVRVGVRDYGTGILDEARERLFDHFFTTKDEGLGMGLVIVRSVVEAHGGKIEAEDVEGGGARFYFTLPVRQEIQ